MGNTSAHAARGQSLQGLYSAENAGYYLNVSRATIYRWVGQGRLVGFRVGRLRRFSRAELDRFVAQLEAEAAESAQSEAS